MKLGVLKIATFNLLNMNQAGLPVYSDTNGWTVDEYNRKIQWMARQLTELNSDLFGFQELWHAQSLHNALAVAGLTAEYDVLTPSFADGSKIVCAAIVRKGLLVGEPEWIEKFPEKFRLQASGDDPQSPEIALHITGFSRPVLHFTFAPRSDRLPVHVYVCHFKSKAPAKVQLEQWFKDDKPTYSKHATALGSAVSTIRRTAEATALRFILTEQMKGNDTPVLVLGDVNDGQHSNTVNILTEQPNYLVGDSLGGGDVALYTAQTLQEYRDTRDVYYTHVFQDLRESLDQILVSQEFYDNSRKRVWLFSGMAINNDHLNFENHKETGTNDHGIVQVTFKYKPIKTDS